MQISVSTDIERAARQLQSIAEAQQLRFAVAKALTQTAKEVQAEVRTNIPKRFTVRRNWIINNIRITPATKAKLEAAVYSGDKFMGLQESGGTKLALKKYIAIPTSMVRRTDKDVIRRSDRPSALGDRVTIQEIKGNKYLALKKPRKGANGQKLRLLYLLIPRAQLKERLGLNKDGARIARLRFAENLKDALEFALKTAR